MRKCSTEGCDGSHKAKGLCGPCYRASRREQKAAYNRRYYETNGLACREQAKNWGRNNAQRKAIRDKARREADPQRIQKKDQRYYEANRERINARNRAYYPANREKALADVALWREANREKTRQYEHRRRTVLEEAGSHTPEEWRRILDFYGHTCPGCGSSERLTVDHVVPLSKGGSNAADNLQPLCVRCNAAKGNRNSIRLAPWAGVSEERVTWGL